MEETYKALKSKVQTLITDLKTIAEKYELKNFNMQFVLHDQTNNQNITFKIDDENNIVISKGADKKETPKETYLSNTESEGGYLRSISSDNTLSTSIFKTSVTEESENFKTEDFDTSRNISEKINKRNSAKETIGKLRGGFIKSTKNEMSDNYSSTSQLNTTIKNIFGGNLSATSLSATSLSATSEVQVGGNNLKYSATSLSPTSDVKVGGNNLEYSATSMSGTSDVSVGSKKSNFSATSLSATSDVKVGGNNLEYSATSYFKKSENKTIKGGNLETSDIINNFDNKKSVSKMDLIRQKIKELETTSDANIFKKNKSSQSGGGIKLNEIKQNVGINSSSTSSLCE
jgi:hypothetical protein